MSLRSKIWSRHGCNFFYLFGVFFFCFERAFASATCTFWWTTCLRWISRGNPVATPWQPWMFSICEAHHLAFILAGCILRGNCVGMPGLFSGEVLKSETNETISRISRKARGRCSWWLKSWFSWRCFWKEVCSKVYWDMFSSGPKICISWNLDPESKQVWIHFVCCHLEITNQLLFNWPRCCPSMPQCWWQWKCVVSQYPETSQWRWPVDGSVTRPLLSSLQIGSWLFTGPEVSHPRCIFSKIWSINCFVFWKGSVLRCSWRQSGCRRIFLCT